MRSEVHFIHPLPLALEPHDCHCIRSSETASLTFLDSDFFFLATSDLTSFLLFFLCSISVLLAYLSFAASNASFCSNVIYPPTISRSENGGWEMMVEMDFDCHGASFAPVFYCPFCGGRLDEKEEKA